MTDHDRETVAIANYRTHMEAEVAAGFLVNAAIPYLIQSAEGMLHGPFGTGATILVRAEHAALARGILVDDDSDTESTAPRAVRIASFATGEDAQGAMRRLDDAGLRYLTKTMERASRLDIFVRREHADRALRIIRRGSSKEA